MRKASGKRLPHGATGDLVLAALWNFAHALLLGVIRMRASLASYSID